MPPSLQVDFNNITIYWSTTVLVADVIGLMHVPNYIIIPFCTCKLLSTVMLPSQHVLSAESQSGPHTVPADPAVPTASVELDVGLQQLSAPSAPSPSDLCSAVHT